MPQISPFDIDIPKIDLLSFVFPEDEQPYEKPIWIDADDISNSLSPKQLLQLVKRLAVGLDKLRIGRGEAVMMFTTNHIFVPVLYFAVAGSGRIFTGCNPAYGVKETTFQLENTGAKAIMVEPRFLDVVLQAAERANLPRDRIFLFGDGDEQKHDEVRDWRAILAPHSESASWQWPRLSPPAVASTVAVLNYSSGTTGLPKGVMISHGNIVANVCQSLFMRDLEQRRGGEERWLGFLPLYHAYGQLWSLVAAAKARKPCYVMRGDFEYGRWLAHVQEHKITHLQTAPPILVMLAKRPETAEYGLGSLVNILCGAAPLSKELQNDVSDRFALKVVQTWGMTELTCSGLHVPGGRDDRSGSVGYADPNSEVKLVGDDGTEVGVGERGEICIKGPNVCLGYWRNEKATRESFDADGFFKSGDVAVRDESGRYWIGKEPLRRCRSTC